MGARCGAGSAQWGGSKPARVPLGWDAALDSKLAQSLFLALPLSSGSNVQQLVHFVMPPCLTMATSKISGACHSHAPDAAG